MSERWIENLKVGEDVAISIPYGFSPVNHYHIAKVKRLTKTQIIVHHNGEDKKFSKNTQNLVGGNNSTYIIQLTDTVLAENRRYELYRELKEMPNFLSKNIEKIVNSDELESTVEFFKKLKNSI